jgi:hypothetical protein
MTMRMGFAQQRQQTGHGGTALENIEGRERGVQCLAKPRVLMSRAGLAGRLFPHDTSLLLLKVFSSPKR